MALPTSKKTVKTPNPKGPSKHKAVRKEHPARPFTEKGGATEELKRHFAAYCQEKADAARERIRTIHSDIAPAKEDFDAAYAHFGPLTEGEAFAERPGAETLVNAVTKLASRLQAYSSALAECYACMSLIEAAQSVDNVNMLRDRYAEPASDASAEKIRCQQRKYVAKACNYAENTAMAEMRAAEMAAETDSETAASQEQGA